MELKLARTELKKQPKNVSIEKLMSEVQKGEDLIFYFDKNNAHKDLLELVDRFEEEGYSVYFKEIRYGLDKDDYMYQLHVL